MRARAFHVFLVGAALCVAPTVLSQPQFVMLPKPPPSKLGQVDMILAEAIADDGSVFGWNGEAIAWDQANGYTPMMPLFPGTGSEVTSCTPDGKFSCGGVAGSAENKWAVPVLWSSPSTPPVPIPGFPAGWSAYHMRCNADASMVAGSMYQLGTNKDAMFIWRKGVRKNMGWEFIDKFPSGIIYGGFSDVSSNGSMAYGAGPDATLEGFIAFRWRKGLGLEVIPDIPGGITDGTFDTCDASGFRASGWASPPEANWIASVWDEVTGWTKIGKLKPSHSGARLKIDDTGFAGGGTSGFHISNDRTAYVWNTRDGMRPVKDVLINDHGVNVPADWNLEDVDAVSPNGRFLAGRALNKQKTLSAAWWAEIRPFCYADCDNSTSPKGKNAGPPVLDIDDFICFMTKYAVGDYLYADCDLNGSLEIDDFICFQSKFAIGCP